MHKQVISRGTDSDKTGRSYQMAHRGLCLCRTYHNYSDMCVASVRGLHRLESCNKALYLEPHI